MMNADFILELNRNEADNKRTVRELGSDTAWALFSKFATTHHNSLDELTDQERMLLKEFATNWIARTLQEQGSGN